MSYRNLQKILDHFTQLKGEKPKGLSEIMTLGTFFFNQNLNNTSKKKIQTHLIEGPDKTLYRSFLSHEKE